MHLTVNQAPKWASVVRIHHHSPEINADVAQKVERDPSKFHAAGSIPAVRSSLCSNDSFYRRVAQPGRATALGAEGRRFESSHADQYFDVCGSLAEWRGTGLLIRDRTGSNPSAPTKFQFLSFSLGESAALLMRIWQVRTLRPEPVLVWSCSLIGKSPRLIIG